MLAVPSDASAVKLTVQCSMPPGTTRQASKYPPLLETVSTISLANGRFCPDAGFGVKGDKPWTIDFPQRNILKLSLRGSILAFKAGILYYGFPAAQIIITDLVVEMNSPAVAIVGEMTHARTLGTLFISTPGNPEGEWLHPKFERRPLAIRMPE